MILLILYDGCCECWCAQGPIPWLLWMLITQVSTLSPVCVSLSLTPSFHIWPQGSPLGQLKTAHNPKPCHGAFPCNLHSTDDATQCDHEQLLRRVECQDQTARLDCLLECTFLSCEAARATCKVRGFAFFANRPPLPICFIRAILVPLSTWTAFSIRSNWGKKCACGEGRRQAGSWECWPHCLMDAWLF